MIMPQQTTDCPPWEYTDYPHHKTLLRARTLAANINLRRASKNNLLQLAKNTQLFHSDYFDGLTPPGHEYYAGNYRGHDGHICLKISHVQIASDPRVGWAPDEVSPGMAEFDYRADESSCEIDILMPVQTSLVPNGVKFVRISEVVAALFVYFLEIHPYINGNGHMARLMLMSFLAMHRIYLSRWNIDPRPPDPPYTECIKQYRNGNHDPLVSFILRCI